MVQTVEEYYQDGCGRCKLFATEACKTRKWAVEIHFLRSILQETPLKEELKWGHPCYTFKGKNILLVGAFKEHLAANFVKGALLQDKENILVQQTENVQSARQIRFTSINEVKKLRAVILQYITEAIENEKLGKEVQLKKTSEFNVPEELTQAFKENPTLETAFNALTPGRQRGYLLYFSNAKQPKTRLARIEKYAPKIFKGKGYNER